jgi:Mg/Co/Ni transporter MgtE
VDPLDVLGLFSVKLIDWRQANFFSGTVQVGSASKEVVQIHPADLANIIEDLNIQQGSEFIKSLDVATAARVFEEIDAETKRILVGALGPERVAQLTANMPVDELVDLLKSLPEATKEQLMKRLQATKAKSADMLMRYPDRSAGGLMTTDFIHCTVHQTVGDIVEEIRKRSLNFRFVHYVYVVDDQGVFQGVTSIRHLLLSERSAPVQTIMRERKRLRVLRPRQSLREVASVMTKYRLFSVAVLDKDKKILGVVTIDDVMRALFPYA